MELIDWAGLARTALWIIGLSVLLAAASYTSWRASRDHVALRHALGRSGSQAALSCGMLLFAASMVWGATRLWERVAWAALLVAVGWQLWAAMRSLGRSRADDTSGG